MHTELATGQPPRLILASASPRRRELLAQIGVAHGVHGAHIDEDLRAGEAPRDYVLRMAREKALAVSAREPGAAVLAADTSVVLEGVVYGKPADLASAVAMLGALSGRTHEVLTAVALTCAGTLHERLSVSAVRFRPISAAECAAYWHTGEPRDKAGGYAIQGFGAVFVAELRGSYSGVMGLPLFETAELLQAAGIACWTRAA